MNFSNATITDFVIHYIGNQTQGLQLSDEPYKPDTGLCEKLQVWMLSPFANNNEMFEFWHPESLQYNETFNYVSALLAQDTDFISVTHQLARHLHKNSSHPRIKSGELYVARFKNIAVGDRIVDGVGIFKSENKSGFFEVVNQDITYREGVPVHKVDKGCLIVNDRQSLKVFVIDTQNKGEEARYWAEDFLQIRPAADDYHYTKNFLNVTRQFIADHLADRENITRMDQVKMLDESVNYFREKEQFEIGEFNARVFNDPELIQSFQEYGNNYLQQNNVQLSDNFDINVHAVKKQARVFKSVLKLDRNFHIYIHGNRELIERGYDEATGRSFYKIYFEEEN